MSRSGYSEECDSEWQWIKWRGVVASSIRGRRGQVFLRDLLEALDAMPEKRLAKGVLIQGGEVCAVGSLGVRRGVDLQALDPDDYSAIAAAFDVAAPLVQEIEYLNDEELWRHSPEDRWQAVRAWVVKNIKAAAPDA